jgi:hypothetical protein
LIDAVQGSTAGELILDQLAVAGDAGFSPYGDGGDAVSRLTASNPGAGNLSATVLALAGQSLDAGVGGDAEAEVHASGIGAGNVAGTAHAAMRREDGNEGGGNATAVAVVEQDDRGDANANALAQASDGDAFHLGGRDAETHASVASASPGAVTVGGPGGSSSFGAFGGTGVRDYRFGVSSGDGGNAASTSSGMSTGDASVSVFDQAVGGDGGEPSLDAVGGRGGNASSSAYGATGGTQATMVSAHATGGDASGSSVYEGLRQTRGGGDATARTEAHGGGSTSATSTAHGGHGAGGRGGVGMAEALASGPTGMAQADASTANDALAQLTARAVAERGSSGESGSLSRALARASMTGADWFAPSWDDAGAFASALGTPDEDQVLGTLPADGFGGRISFSEASMLAELGLGMTGAAGPASASVAVTLDALRVPVLDDVVIALFDLEQSDEALGDVQLSIELGGTVLLDTTLALSSAHTILDDQLIHLAAFGLDPGALDDRLLAVTLRGLDGAVGGLSFHALVTVPEPGLLQVGVCALLLLRRSRRSRSGNAAAA